MTRQIHILYLYWQFNTYFYGGNDVGIALFLQKRGHKVTFLVTRPVFSPGPPVPKNLPFTFKYVRVPNIKLPPLFWRNNNILMRLKITSVLWLLIRAMVDYSFRFWLWRHSRHSYDIIQCCDFLHLPAWIVRQGTPAVTWLSTPFGRKWRGTLHRLTSTPRLGIFTHGTTAISLEEMGLKRGTDFADIPPGIHPPDETLLGNPAHRKRQPERLQIGEGELLGVTAARLASIKNHGMLIDAIAIAKARGIVWRWVMLGDGETKAELQGQIEALGLEGQVHLIGNQPLAHVYRWLAVADIFALTSHYESYCIAVLEALAYGLPVIGTRVGYMQHLISEAGGVLVDSNDSDGLAKVLVAFADKSVRQKHAGTPKAVALAKRHYWSQIAKQLEDFYGDLITKT